MKFMGYIFLAILFATVSTSFADESMQMRERPDAQENKTYLDPSNIFMDSQGIHVLINQNWQTTNAVFSDAKGLYIVDSKAAWTCGVCGFYNTNNPRFCDNCHHPR